MTMLITDPEISDSIREERIKKGLDGFDEVWEGVYVMSPLADDEHQDLQTGFGATLKLAAGWNGPARVRTGVNVSDRVQNWKHNYRVPDVAVFLPGGSAVNHGTFWFGGPDLVVEIVSTYDQTREKLPFYEKVRVREVVIVDRNPWALELHRLTDGRLELVSRIEIGSPDAIATDTVPLSMRLLAGTPRPLIEVTQPETSQQWVI
jgi:Uma2 family endonuclease